MISRNSASSQLNGDPFIHSAASIDVSANELRLSGRRQRTPGHHEPVARRSARSAALGVEFPERRQLVLVEI